MIDTAKGITLVRTFPATPEQIFTAWTDAAAIAPWWHPRGARTPRDDVAVDPQVGGRYTYTMVNEATGDRVVTAGIYRALVPAGDGFFYDGWDSALDSLGDYLA